MNPINNSVYNSIHNATYISTNVTVRAGRDIHQSQTSTFRGPPDSDSSRAQNMDNVTGMTLENTSNHERQLRFLHGKLLHVIVKASYEDQGKQPCEAGTRVDILEEIKPWLRDTSTDPQRFYWLSGDPGVGKSAITASIAQRCIDEKTLGAEFFINRNDAATTDPRNLFPTLCYQLCKRFPRAAEVMEQALYERPTLFDHISDPGHAKHLFLDVIKAAAAINPFRAVVVVIDALDETDAKRLKSLAGILSEVVADMPHNAKVFISSRGENDITKAFNSLRRRERVKSRYLAAKESIQEVSSFMKSEVEKILQDHEIDWTEWGDDNMNKLSSRASGLFIWARTALNFLQAEIGDKGTACFKGFSNMLATKGMDDIDTLYLNILRKTCEDSDWKQRGCSEPGYNRRDKNNWVYERFRRIVGAILVRQTPLSIADIGQLLNLKDRDYSNPVDVVHFVRQYRTVLVNDAKQINNGVIPGVHRSFADFITSEKAQEFRVDKSASHGELVLRCIDQLCALNAYFEEKEKEIVTSFPAQLAYISQHWQSHLTRMVEPGLNDDLEEKHDDGSDEFNIFEGNDTPGSPAEPLGTKELKPEAPETGDRWVLLAFSLAGNQLASASNRTTQLRDAKTGSVTKFLVGHEAPIWSVGFSPDGTQLVTASWDHTARIWDTRTGKELHILNGHTDHVMYAGYSHDGRTVATCSWDSTLRSWDAQTGQPLKIFEVHKYAWPVYYCTFSPNDERIASRSWRGDIFVWDVNTGHIVSKMLHHHGRQLISFCPCGNHIISRGDGEIRLWDAESGNQLGNTNSVTPLAFVKDSDGSEDGYIKIPQAVEHLDPSIHHIYSFETKHGTVWGILEHGQGMWVWVSPSLPVVKQLHFGAGATKMTINLPHLDNEE